MKKLLSCLSLVLLGAVGVAQSTQGLKVNESKLGSHEIQNFVQPNQSGGTSFYLATEYCIPSSSSSSTFIDSFSTTGGHRILAMFLLVMLQMDM